MNRTSCICEQYIRANIHFTGVSEREERVHYCVCVCVCVCVKWQKIYQIWQETISYRFKKLSKHEIGTQMNLNQNTLQSIAEN